MDCDRARPSAHLHLHEGPPVETAGGRRQGAPEAAAVRHGAVRSGDAQPARSRRRTRSAPSWAPTSAAASPITSSLLRGRGFAMGGARRPPSPAQAPPPPKQSGRGALSSCCPAWRRSCHSFIRLSLFFPKAPPAQVENRAPFACPPPLHPLLANRPLQGLVSPHPPSQGKLVDQRSRLAPKAKNSMKYKIASGVMQGWTQPKVAVATSG